MRLVYSSKPSGFSGRPGEQTHIRLEDEQEATALVAALAEYHNHLHYQTIVMSPTSAADIKEYQTQVAGLLERVRDGSRTLRAFDEAYIAENALSRFVQIHAAARQNPRFYDLVVQSYGTREEYEQYATTATYMMDEAEHTVIII